MRSVLKHLVDAASSEFLFILEFFGGSNKSKTKTKTKTKTTQEIFDTIFKKTLSTILENVDKVFLNIVSNI